MPPRKRSRDNNNNLIASLRNAQFVENPDPNNQGRSIALGVPLINQETFIRRQNENIQAERRRQLRNNVRNAHALERSLNAALNRFVTNRGFISNDTHVAIVRRIRNFLSANPDLVRAYAAVSGNNVARQRFLGDIYSMLNFRR